jgi:hypothetical protein
LHFHDASHFFFFFCFLRKTKCDCLKPKIITQISWPSFSLWADTLRRVTTNEKMVWKKKIHHNYFLKVLKFCSHCNACSMQTFLFKDSQKNMSTPVQEISFLMCLFHNLNCGCLFFKNWWPSLVVNLKKKELKKRQIYKTSNLPPSLKFVPKNFFLLFLLVFSSSLLCKYISFINIWISRHSLKLRALLLVSFIPQFDFLSTHYHHIWNTMRGELYLEDGTYFFVN